MAGPKVAALAVVVLIPLPSSEGTNRDAHLVFAGWMNSWMKWTDHHHHACAWAVRCVAMSFLIWSNSFGTFCEYVLAISLKRTYRYECNKRGNTGILRVYKRQLRLQKRREQRRGRLACETTGKREQRLQFRHEAKGRRKRSCRAEENSLVAQKRLETERLRGASRRECQKAEQTTRRLLDQSEAMEMIKITTTTQPATKLTERSTSNVTSSSETMWTRTSKAWT